MSFCMKSSCMYLSFLSPGCDSRADSEDGLDIESAAENRTEASGGPFKCTECEASFTSQPNFYSHLTTHPRVRPFHCIACSATFRHLSNLRRHALNHTAKELTGLSGPVKTDGADRYTGNPVEENPFKCTDCGARFKVLRGLSIHQNIHKGEKPFKCTECESTFEQPSGLTQHLRMHSEQLTCTVCEVSFRSYARLKLHMKMKHDSDKVQQEQVLSLLK